MTQPFLWWQTGSVYQIYPRSFMDSDGDGTGDLKGIVAKLDYLSWLGIDALWLSPIFPSPMADFGYDVANYVDIDPLFGTLADFDVLLEQAHARGIKVLLDLVPNHTSDEHPWFVESRSSRDNPKRDWYVWRDAKPDGSLPNNWDAFFGGDAWEFDPTTEQYYLHLFHKKQPDLNWRNPEVRAAMYDAMRFWLDRGVDGFRVDVIWLLIKDEQFRDNPLNPDWKEGDAPFARFQRVYTEDQPETHQIVREMRALLDEYDERVLIGEIYLPLPRLMKYYGESLDEAHLPFNFQLVLLPWQAQAIRKAVDDYETALPEGAWPNWVLGNHDQHRVASRIGAQQARVAQMLLLTLRGTPTCYYGDEIGMHDVPIPHELAYDPQELLSPGYGRDPERTPMQWDASANAGFSTAKPWLPIADDYAANNVEAQRDDPTSMLSLFRRLIELRNAVPALTIGSHRSLDAGSDEVFAYLRETPEQRILVVLNLGSSAQTLDLSAAGTLADVICSTHMDRTERVDLTQLALRPDEGVVLALG
ncbi:MAG TPA: alpha-amylase family glycosyl hydrolase [Herpetosiphonaceae bacterium]